MNMVSLGDFIPSKIPSVNPAKFLDETFELWSIPAFDAGKPEVLLGSNIGSSKKCIEPGDVLLSRIVPHIRRSCVVSPRTSNRQIASGEWIIFRGNAFDPDYLRQILVSDPFNAKFMQTVAGVGGSLLRARPEGVKQIKIPLPPLEEQKRIAGILDQAARVVRLRQQALDKVNSLGQAIFHEMFASGTTQRRSRALGECLTFVTSGGRGWAKYYSENGSRFIRSLDVQINEIGEDEVVWVAPPNNAEARRTRVACGDVLLTITGSKIGRAAPVPLALEGSFISQHVAILRPDRLCIVPEFLSYFLNMEEFGQKQIRAKQYGQAKPGLNFEQIRGFQIPDVSVDKQKEFVRCVDGCLQTAISMKAQRSAATALFSSLQHRAFQGEL